MAADVRAPTFLRTSPAEQVKNAPFSQGRGGVGKARFGLPEPAPMRQIVADRRDAAAAAENATAAIRAETQAAPAPQASPEPEPEAYDEPNVDLPVEVPTTENSAIASDSLAAELAQKTLELDAEIGRLRERVALAIQSLEQEKMALREEATTDALKLGLEIARVLVRREIEVSSEPLMNVVKDILRELNDAREVSLRLHPDDVLALEARGFENEEGFSAVELVVDPTLARGDVIVDSEHGAVEARFEARLESIRKALVGALGATS